MRICLVLMLALSLSPQTKAASEDVPAKAKKVFILPIRDEIRSPLLYLVRRGVKQAMEAKADLLLIDMDTNGGELGTTLEIISILNEFKGETATYVNKYAFSAGAFIAVATQKIYMAPGSVIGAAAPIMVSPGSDTVEKIPDTYERKIVSAVRALVRTSAEKNGYNIAVVEAMIDKTKGLTIDGEVLVKEGELLTLTNTEAEKNYGTPAKPLLSSGTKADFDAVLSALGYAHAERHDIKTTGVERLGTWLNAISPLLLIIGVVGIYIEFKTPGFGLPGIIGISAFALYFLGGYVAGLSGLEWVIVFTLGLLLVAVEIFFYPGTIAIGLAGATLMFAALIMAMVDMYPGGPLLPSLPQLRVPITNMLIAAGGAVVAIIIAARFLPMTPVYRKLVSQSASGVQSEALQQKEQLSQQGQIGVTISKLRPGGKAQFGDAVLDVISQGDLVPKGAKVRIIGHSGREAIVEVVT